MATEAIHLEKIKLKPTSHHNKINFKLTKELHKQGERYKNIRKKCTVTLW